MTAYTRVLSHIGVGLITLLGVVSAFAGEKKFAYHVSGSAISSTIDTNGDNSRATVTNLGGKSTLGKIHLQSVNESKLTLSNPADPRSVVPCQTPHNEPGIEFETVQGRGVLRVESGDLLFTKIASGTNCVPLSCLGAQGQLRERCAFTTTQVSDIVGGTGKYSGASGTFNVTGSAEVLLAEPTGSFFALTLDAAGTLVLP
jgi:hypothetical protein